MTRINTRTITLATALLLGVAGASGCTGELNAEGEGGAPSMIGGETPALGDDSGGETPTTPDDPDPTMDAGMEDAPDGGVGGESLEPVDPNTLSQRELFTCKDPDAPRSSPARLKRLIDTEWTRAVGESARSEASKNPLQPNPASLYSTYDRGLTLDTATLDQYLGMSEVPLLSTGMEHYRCFRNEDAPDDECITHFVTELLERRVYFRPPTSEETAQIVALAKSNLAREAPDIQDRKDTIRQIVRGAWVTSGALFATEFGAQPDEHDRYMLTDWEIARALARAISDRAPSAPQYLAYNGITPEGVLFEIRQAALDGTLSDREVIADIARRHLAGEDGGTMAPTEHYPHKVDGKYVEPFPPEIEALKDRERSQAIADWVGRFDLERDRDFARRAKRSQYWMSDKMLGFFREWLDYGKVTSAFKDRPWETSRFEEIEMDKHRMTRGYTNMMEEEPVSLELALTEQLDQVIARAVALDRDVIRELLTTREYYVRQTERSGGYAREQFGYVYDINTREETILDTRADRWRTMREGDRAGVLTHPTWLAAHGGNFENDPSAIHRGQWIREKLLCNTVPDVPVGVEAQLDPETVHDSARARIQETTEQPQCAGCHVKMNPLGYPFEIYNHAGYLRAIDHGMPPDGSSVLFEMPDGDDALSEGMQVQDAVSMMEAFGDSSHVRRCVIRQSFRYFMGRDETMADACTLAQMESDYEQSGGSLVEMIVSLLTSDTFLYRTRLTEETR